MKITRNVGAAAILVGIGLAGVCGAMAQADTSYRRLSGDAAPSTQAPGGATRTADAVASGFRPPQGVPPVMGGPFPPPHLPPPGQPHLASLLSASETLLGIRADQLDAWRDFTDAFLALAQPTRPSTPSETPEPFARPAALANKVMADGKKAEALASAIDRLKAKLSPAQLERAAQLDAQLLPPPPPFWGGPPNAGPGAHRPPPLLGVPG